MLPPMVTPTSSTLPVEDNKGTLRKRMKHSPILSTISLVGSSSTPKLGDTQPLSSPIILEVTGTKKTPEKVHTKVDWGKVPFTLGFQTIRKKGSTIWVDDEGLEGGLAGSCIMKEYMLPTDLTSRKKMKWFNRRLEQMCLPIIMLL